MFRTFCFPLAVVSSFSAASAIAAPVTLINPSFEQGSPPYTDNAGANGGVSGAIPGFTATLDVTQSDYSFYGVASDRAGSPGVDGQKDLFFRNARLVTAAGDRPAASAGDTFSLLLNGRTEGSGPGLLASIDFFDAGGARLATNEETFLADAQPFVYVSDLSIDDALAPAGTSSVGLRIETQNATQVLTVDNLRLDVTPVPEPASLALLGLGSAALLGRRRR